jgi:hypothetical protein
MATRQKLDELGMMRVIERAAEDQPKLNKDTKTKKTNS